MRVIDADALYEKVTDEIYKFYNDVGGGYWLAEDVLEEIDSAPTIEAEPVRHGKWEVKQQTKKINEYNMTISGKYPTCNLCGFAETGPFNKTNYCPNCGAKMSLE